jgi:hypothetical protein
MKVELRIQPGHPVPQFLIFAETDAERVVLRNFIEYPIDSEVPVRFWIHGTQHDETGMLSFNFGYAKVNSWHISTLTRLWATWIATFSRGLRPKLSD